MSSSASGFTPRCFFRRSDEAEGSRRPNQRRQIGRPSIDGRESLALPRNVNPPRPLSAESSCTAYRPGERLLDRGLRASGIEQTFEDSFMAENDISFETDYSCNGPVFTTHSTPLRDSTQMNIMQTPPGSISGTSPSLDITSLLQEQQAMLQKVFSAQEALLMEQTVMKSKQKDLEEKLNSIDKKILSFEHSSDSSCSGSDPRWHRVTRDLTVKVCAVYESLQRQFDLSERSIATHNKTLMEEIKTELLKTPGNTHTEGEIKAAIRRKYEALRRQWLVDQKENSQELIHQTAKKKKYRSRRQRKFSNRSAVVTKAEDKYWNQLDINYMTEESDDPSDNMIIVEHKPAWRSQKLSEFLNLLDDRLEKSSKKVPEDGTVARKTRRLGSPRTQPPEGAPKWTIDLQWARDNGYFREEDSGESFD